VTPKQTNTNKHSHWFFTVNTTNNQPKAGTDFWVDVDASSDWWRKHFPSYQRLVFADTSTPFQIDPQTEYSQEHGRFGSLICPGRPFTYSCELEASQIRASAAGVCVCVFSVCA
jgi:hypothetical protein